MFMKTKYWCQYNTSVWRPNDRAFVRAPAARTLLIFYLHVLRSNLACGEPKRVDVHEFTLLPAEISDIGGG
jgi:hypothetical protein